MKKIFSLVAAVALFAAVGCEEKKGTSGTGAKGTGTGAPSTPVGGTPAGTSK
ncbi:MAG: hypothetical protein N2112_01410 [Gemmataceae bacterium]|jgi:hypothetical protein|nr:hypothetical protein [Gemmataceae bacterium]